MASRTPSSTLREFLPPAARRLANRFVGGLTVYRGPYSDWDAAAGACAGYHDARILDRVVAATRRVLDDQDVYEQDGCALHGTPAPSHALSALLLASSLDGGRLSVVDFGGGLGTHFLRWRPWWAPLRYVTWCVVEQPHYVDAARHLFAPDGPLRFAASLDETTRQEPNAVLASSVLQYLRDPFACLDALVSLDARVLVIDRTPFLSAGSTPMATTQHVSRRLGAASYPLWLLPRDPVYARLASRYRLLLEFPGTDDQVRTGGTTADYRGCIWLRKD